MDFIDVVLVIYALAFAVAMTTVAVYLVNQCEVEFYNAKILDYHQLGRTNYLTLQLTDGSIVEKRVSVVLKTIPINATVNVRRNGGIICVNGNST